MFLDTTVLVAGSIELGSPESVHARVVLDAVASGRMPRPLTAWHCCLEFFSVTTRLPEEYRLRPRDALFLLENEILAHVTVHDLPAAGRIEFLRYATSAGVAGGRIYDVHIASVAVSAGARVVVTDNVRDFSFAPGSGIRVLRIAEAAAELS